MSRVNGGVAEQLAVLNPAHGGARDIGLGLNWFAAAAFACGMTGPIVIRLIGEIYVGELLLIQFAFLLLLLGGIRSLLTLPTFGVFVQTAVLMLLGYMLSDIYRDAHPAQFLRGWAKIILVTLDFVALAAIVAHDKRNLWWFVLGLALGSICELLIREVPITSVSGWKSGYSTPLVSLLACLSCFLPIRLACVAFAALGIWNIFMDFRILGAICVLVAAVLWVRSGGASGFSRRQMLRLIMMCVLAASIVVGALLATQDEFSKRREQSNAGRQAGLTVAAWAIMESPIIGYGSWPMDARLVNFYEQKIEETGKPEWQRNINVFISHSQVLQGWVEGGVLGVLFWLYYGYWLVRSGWYVALQRPADTHLPIYLFFLVYDFWHLVMSPFAGATRFLIAVGVAIICVCAAERRPAHV